MVSPFAGSQSIRHQSRTWQLFGQIGTIAPAPLGSLIQPSVAELPGTLLSKVDQCDETRLWLLSGFCRQAIRENEALPVGPLNQAQIAGRSAPVPPGASYSSRGLGQWMVRLVKPLGQAVFFVDAAQEIELWAKQIVVTPWAPAGTIVVGESPAATFDGTVFDALLQGSVEPIQVSKGPRLPKYTTRHVLENGGGSLAVEIPPYAKYLQAYFSFPLSGEVAAPLVFWAWGDDPNAPFARVPLPFVEGPATTFEAVATDRILVPDATHLVFDDNDLDPDINVVCVWELAV
jgi:hypothetical protein